MDLLDVAGLWKKGAEFGYGVGRERSWVFVALEIGGGVGEWVGCGFL